jgi:hypothetical protein
MSSGKGKSFIGTYFWTILITVLVVDTVLVSFSGAFLRLGSLVACAGASDVVIEDSSGGQVHKVGNPSGGVATTIHEMTCTYADGRTKTVGNDPLFLYGFATATAIGAAIGSLIVAVSILRRSGRMKTAN